MAERSLYRRNRVEPELLPDDLREAWEERAAIIEYDAGKPRYAAERVAWNLVTGHAP